MSDSYQEINNTGSFINSIGDKNINTLNVSENSVFDSAIREIVEHLQGNEQEDAKAIVESIEDAMKKEKPRVAQKFFDSLPHIAKALPAVIQIGEKIASLLN